MGLGLGFNFPSNFFAVFLASWYFHTRASVLASVIGHSGHKYSFSSLSLDITYLSSLSSQRHGFESQYKEFHAELIPSVA